MHTLENRWLIDITFFLIVNVIMLNIIFGIIIDTFSELRRRKNAREADINGRCFVCGIDKETFDRTLDGTDGFNNHIKKGSGDHHMWHYFYFIVFIWEQDKDDDDGLEWYIRRCISKKDISWFPMSTAISLRQKGSAAAEESNTMRGHVQQKLRDSEAKITRAIHRFVADANSHLESFTKSLLEPSKVINAQQVESSLWGPSVEGSGDDGEEGVSANHLRLQIDEDDVSDISSVGA
jgi:hypothetical protein